MWFLHFMNVATNSMYSNDGSNDTTRNGTNNYGKFGKRGTDGYYASSTASGNNNAYFFSLNNTKVNPGTDRYSKYTAASVRCVALDPII